MEAFLALDWSGWFTLALFLLTIAVLVLELFPPDVVLLSAAGICVFLNIITPAQFLAGFSHDLIFTIAMLFIVAESIEQSGVLSKSIRQFFPNEERYHFLLPSMMLVIIVFSAFLNNTPIVLMVTPLVRRWALQKKQSPSQYLMPLSYASILGGSCTLIGTSSNLVVDGLLRNDFQQAGFTFFELSLIGIPCCLAGVLYMATVGRWLLPNRPDPQVSLIKESRGFVTEFIVSEGCPLIGLNVLEAKSKFFGEEYLLEIERPSEQVDDPSDYERIFRGDRLVFAGEIKEIVGLHNIEGLKSAADPHFNWDPSSSHFSEVVISTSSSLIGKSLKRVDFRRHYDASVVAIFRQGTRVKGRIGEIVLRPGDTLLLISSGPWERKDFFPGDFYTIQHDTKVKLPSRGRTFFVLGVISSMIFSVVMGVPLMLAAFFAAFVLVGGRCLTLREARKSIRWSLLILIASSFAFGKALIATGVANAFAKTVLSIVGSDPYLLIGGIFFLTSLITAFITNNAAALLLYPIAIEMVQLAGYYTPETAKSIGVAVAIGSSCSFATPIGYQTNTIVYGPGGYRFMDYVKVGLPLTLIVMLLSIFLIPYFWPFVAAP